MKELRFLSLCLALALLGGCAGNGRSALESVSVPASTEEAWGIQVAPSSSPATDPAPSSSPDPTPEPTPSPTPTPEPLPGSLRELVTDAVTIWVDGTALDGVLLGDTVLVKADDLTAAWTWLQWQEAEEQAVFTLKTGETAALACTRVDGREYPLEGYAGEGGVWFAGENTEYWLPVSWLSEGLGQKVLWDWDNYTAYVSAWVNTDTVPLDYHVPILMYHAVSDNMWGINELFVSPSDMEQQLQYLVDNGYDPIFFSDLPNLAEYDKPILLTFDDGYDDNYDYLFPLLQKYNVKATCFVITGMLGDEHYMTAEQAREMSASGLVDIQSHTVDHHELNTLGWDDQEYQISQSQMDIARITGKVPYVISYPNGSRDSNTLEIAPQYYAYGIDMNGGTWQIEGGIDNYKVDRIYISRYTTLDEFAGKVS